MYQKATCILVACFFTLYATAQKPKLGTAPAGRNVYNFVKINPKLEYVFVEDKPTKEHPRAGDDVMLRMIALCNNRFMYSSSQKNMGQPGAFTISKALYEGDIADALMLMTPGDSLICLADAKAMYDYSNKPMPDYIKPGDKIQYNIRLVSIKPQEEIQKEREAAMQMQQQAVNQKIDTMNLVDADDIALQDYFTSKHINPIKTKSGLYYSIQKEGSGPYAIPGDKVEMNYRGTLLDGTVFDSNIDSAFMYLQPINFILGTGRVIKGWDEGICYLKPGSKATFFIPSSLAYGDRSRPGNAANPKGVPANSILIFDVELLSARHAP